MIKKFLSVLMLITVVGACTKETPYEASRRHYKAGLTYVRERNLSKAILAFDYATQLYPGFNEPYYQLGLIYAEMGGVDNAIKYFTIFLSREPEHSDTKHRLLRLYYLSGRAEETIEIAADILTETPDHLETHRMLGDVYLFKLKDLDAAKFHFMKVLKVTPDDPEIFMKLARIAYLEGDAEGVNDCCCRVLAIQPKNIEPYMLLLKLYKDRGQKREQIGIYEKLIALRPKELKYRIRLAELLFEFQELEQAKVQAQEIKRKDPTDPLSSYILGYIYLQEQDYDSAKEEFEEALAGKYKSIESLISLGKIYRKREQWDEALKTYFNLSFTRPELFEPRFYLTKLLLKKKEWVNAADSAEKLAVRFPQARVAYFFGGVGQICQLRFHETIRLLSKFFNPPYPRRYKTRLRKSGLYKKFHPEQEVPGHLREIDTKYEMAGHYLLGLAYLAEHKPDKAIAEFTEASILDPTYSAPHTAKAIAYHLQGKFPQALDSCRQAKETLEADEALLNLLRGNIYLSQGDLVNARKYFDKSDGAVGDLSFSSMGTTFMLEEQKPLLSAHISLAVLFLRHGWKKPTLKEARSVLADRPKHPVAAHLVEGMYRLMNKYYKRENIIFSLLHRIAI